MSERYKRTRLIGQGRAGEVYEAEDTQLPRKVAIRRFHNHAGKSGEQFDEWEERFVDMVSALSRLSHPSILGVVDGGIDNSGSYLVTVFVEGLNLGDYVAQTEEPFSVIDAYESAAQILEALTIAETENFYHLSLSPSSVMVQKKHTKGHNFILTDMGHSEIIGMLQGESDAQSVIRRPELIAPEIFEGEPGSGESGQYLLGQLLYWMLAGTHPCSGLPMEQAYLLHKQGGFPSLFSYRPEIPKEFVKWLEVLMQPEASNRYASLSEAARALPEAPKRIFSKKVVIPPTPIRAEDLLTA